MYRDITMKEISEQHIGQTLQVAGWVENIRDHSNVSFVDLRDMYGVLQVVMKDTALMDGISKEMCLSIEGVVEKRDEDTIPTGTIELDAKRVTVHGRVYRQLPFEIITSSPLKIPLSGSQKCESEGQYHLPCAGDQLPETEDDRDGISRDPDADPVCIVPSRKYKGKFYALPQAPQDLMCGAPGDVTEQQLREVHIKVRE